MLHYILIYTTVERFGWRLNKTDTLLASVCSLHDSIQAICCWTANSKNLSTIFSYPFSDEPI